MMGAKKPNVRLAENFTAHEGTMTVIKDGGKTTLSTHYWKMKESEEIP